MPDIAASLGEVERVSWVVVSYLVATTIAAPVYGRLGDLLGRERLMFVALAVFVSASVLCAVAPTILSADGGALLQGLGGGGLMTLSQALVGEVVPPRERARYQGYMASVFVCSSTFGPVAGGWLTQHFGWESVFMVNLPLGAAGAGAGVPAAESGGRERAAALRLHRASGCSRCSSRRALLALEQAQRFDVRAAAADRW